MPNTKQLNVRLPDTQNEWLEHVAAQHRVPKGWVMRELIEAEMASPRLPFVVHAIPMGENDAAAVTAASSGRV